MSKRVKALIEKDYERRLGHVDAVAVINPRGIDANSTNKLRAELAEKGVKMTVVKNTLVKRSGISLDGFEGLLDGPSALVYGAPAAEGSEPTAISTVCRALVDHFEGDETVELRGVFFDGEVFHGADGVKRVSKFPTREEAIADVLGAVLGPASSLAGALSGPGGALAGILKALEEKGDE